VSYWVRYRSEDERGGYREKTGKAGTIMALASQINEIHDRGWRILSVGANSPRPLDAKERSVISLLTHGREIP
jgi:hypothetical protein